MTDEQYYLDKEYLTNTMTGWLLVGPKYYKKQMSLIGLETGTEKYFVFGNAVHCRLLERDEFANRYFVNRGEAPQNAIQKKFCDLLSAHDKSDKNARISAYKMSYSASKMTDDAIDKKSKVLLDTFKEHIEAKRFGAGKIELTQDEFSKIKKIEHNVLKHASASRLLRNSEVMWYNEIVILYEYKGIKMKSKLDRLEIDFNSKTIRLIDVKTHSIRKEDINFSESFRGAFRRYKYHKQMYTYFIATKRFFEREFPNLNFDDFKFEIKIIAIKSNFDNDVVVFKVDGTYLMEGEKLFNNAINRYKYYQVHGYETSYDADDDGEEVLKYE